MLFHAHRSDDYFALRVDTYASLTRVQPISLNGSTLVAKDKLTDQIYTALEHMDADERIKSFCKAADEYLNTIEDSIRKHAEGFKKQIALLKEAVQPIMKVNTIFNQIYGNKVFNDIANDVAITYFPNCHKSFKGGSDGSYPLYIIESLSNDLSTGSDDKLYKDLVALVQCPEVGDGQLDFPELGPVTTPWKKPCTLKELGYTPEYAIEGLNTLVNNGQHVILFSYISAFLNTIAEEKRKALKYIDEIRHFSDDLPNYVKLVRDAATKLQVYSVALGVLMVVTNAAAYSAYEAAYKFHVAEIEYNKSQTK